jgi:hypothetical protein
MNPRTSKARTTESLVEDLDRASALISQGTTSAHSHGLIMLDELEKLESQGLLAARPPLLSVRRIFGDRVRSIVSSSRAEIKIPGFCTTGRSTL